MAEFAKLVRKSGDLDRLTVQNKAKWAAALAESAEVAGSVARQLVPVRTGALRDSIFVRQTGNLKFEIGAGNSKVDYAGFIELGTEYMEARPYIGPALVLARRHLRNLLAKG